MTGRSLQLDQEQVNLISKALAEPKRLEMLKRIGESAEPPTCSCLVEAVDLAPATISHHLKELEQAGLVAIERDGKFAHVSFRRDVWNAYLKWLALL